MNPKQPKLVDPKAVFISAEVWAAATGVLQRSWAAKATLADIYVPMIVSAAFTAELYGKCLLLLETRSYCGLHDLEEIFRQLKARTKTRIKKQHNALVPSDENMAFLTEPEKADLDMLLARCKNTFEDFRYWFENPNFFGYAFGLWTLTTCLRDEILSHRPQWEHEL